MGNARRDWCEVARHVVALDPIRVANIVLDLVTHDQLLLMSTDCEAELLVVVVEPIRPVSGTRSLNACRKATGVLRCQSAVGTPTHPGGTCAGMGR